MKLMLRFGLLPFVVSLAVGTIHGSCADTGPGRASADDRQRRSHRRGREPRGSQRDSRRVFGADGDARAHPAVRPPALRTNRPRDRGHVPMVGHDDPDLHAGRQAPPATRHAVRRHRRRHCGGGQRPTTGRGVHVQLHDADGQAAADDLVPARRTIRRAVCRYSCDSTSRSIR